MTRARIALLIASPAILIGWLVARGGLDEWSGARVRAVVAFAALGCVAFLRARRRAGRPLPAAWAQGLLGAAAIAAAAAWFDFGALPHTGGVHRHDVFHYYLGGKYPRELGYDLIYRCTAIAEAENGREAEVRRRALRDLDTLEVVPAATVLDALDVCRPRFSPERWASFREDVARLRGDVSDTAWEETQTDYGYNPTPAWAVVGGTLARLVPSTDAGLRALCLVDFALVAGAIVALFAAFGWRTAALALILWGTQEPGKFTWLGFAMLRLDWLFLLVASLALLRRGRAGLAGAALGWSAAIRVFPAIGLAGVVLAGVASPALRTRFAGQRRRFAAGFAGAIVLAVALGAAVAGPSSWSAWSGHIRRHVAAPSSNDVGLGVVIAFDPEHRVEREQERLPGAPTTTWTRRWSEETRAAREARRLPLRALQLAYGALLLLALARARRPWIGLVLAVLAAPAATVMSGYYLVFFLVAAALVAARPWLERGLLAFAGTVQLLMVMPAVAWFVDDRHFALSLVYVGASAAITAAIARRRRVP